jgi:hypothetical protein
MQLRPTRFSSLNVRLPSVELSKNVPTTRFIENQVTDKGTETFEGLSKEPEDSPSTTSNALGLGARRLIPTRRLDITLGPTLNTVTKVELGIGGLYYLATRQRWNVNLVHGRNKIRRR